ncbi:early nodulin-like protein 1 [Canna indica]|uniref:Early nodulin-like protein 1 n=1 Tax=Canna indica TaxID=4628 RepID=A0AAQ3QK51_9LILI|nr:early nodulin-like protein 1 [Canna indica]
MAQSCIALLFLSVAMLLAMAADATQFKVGGSNGWSVPDPNAMSFNQWAERNRFHIGDSLLFVYPPDKDSVLQVDKDAYDACNTSTFIAKYDDGSTVFTLNRSGAFYFISGVEANCIRNESLIIMVMADRTDSGRPAVPAPAPSPTPPSEAASEPSPPRPPPAPEAASEPPPSNGEATVPAAEPAPAGEEPPPPPPPSGAAASRVVGFVGVVGSVVMGIVL